MEQQKSLREAILAPRALKRETVHVPEWDVDVVVQELTAAERDAFEASCLTRKGKKMEPNTANLRAKLIVQTLRKEDGTRIFGDGDVDEVGKLSAAAVNRLFEVASRLSGLTEEDVEELEKN